MERKTNKGLVILANVVCAVLVLGALIIARLVSWVFHNWGNLKMDELVFTMGASLEGVNQSMIEGAVLYILPFALVGLLIWIIIVYGFLRKSRHVARIKICSIILSVLASAFSLCYFGIQIGAVDYVKNQMKSSSFIADNYVDPKEVSVTFPEQKRNLIYIFVESMEMTFSDIEEGGGKNENIIPGLTELGLENETFAGQSGILNGGEALYGATYTMGGLFAQTSGLPLMVSTADITLSEGFLPGVTVLGDILKENGYKNVFCIGTDAAFGDRGTYFNTHGDYEIMDYNYSVEHGEIPADFHRDWWGYDDYILYENAKKHLTELSKSSQPFNFTMLTVDTHAEDGYICELCDDKYEVKYSNAFACSSAQVTEFVKWIKEQDFYENTTIVITGDHCTMDSDYCDDVDDSFERRVFTTWINSAVKATQDTARQYSTMDYFPTTLAALGADIAGDKLGLGTNLFSDKETLVEEYGKDYLDEELSRGKSFFKGKLGEIVEHDMVAKYDDEKGSILVQIGSDIDYSGKYDHIFCEVADPEGRTVRQNMTLEGENFSGEVALDDFDFKEQGYGIEVYIMLPDGLRKWYSGTSLNIDKINYQPPLVITLDDSGKQITIEYDADPDMPYSHVWVPVWSDVATQDDLDFYQAESDGDGHWTTHVNLEDHTLPNGPLVIQVYAGETSPEEILYSRKWYND